MSIPSPINHPAVRAFQRLWAPIDKSLALGAEMAAKFDGGEWSGHAHERFAESAYFSLVTRVAARFEMEPAELEDHIYRKLHEESDWWQYAMTIRARAAAAIGRMDRPQAE